MHIDVERVKFGMNKSQLTITQEPYYPSQWLFMQTKNRINKNMVFNKKKLNKKYLFRIIKITNLEYMCLNVTHKLIKYMNPDQYCILM